MDSLQIGLGLTAVTILSISGTFAAQIAMARRRSPVLWFVYGVALGPVGPVLVWLSPPASCPICNTPTRGWLRRCEGCGADTTVGPARRPLAGVTHARPTGAAVAHPALLPVYRDSPPRRPARDSAAATRRGPIVGTGSYGRPGAREGAGVPADTSVAQSQASWIAGPVDRPEAPRPEAASGPEAPSRLEPPPAPEAPIAREPGLSPSAVSGAGGALALAGQPVPARPSSGPATDATPHHLADEPQQTSLLATGVFTGGTAGLVVGARYAIVRAGAEFHVLGPLDSSPDSIVLRRPLDELDPLCVNDRCIISHRSQPTRALIAMRGIAGLTGEHLEAALRPATRVGEAAS